MNRSERRASSKKPKGLNLAFRPRKIHYFQRGFLQAPNAREVPAHA